MAAEEKAGGQALCPPGRKTHTISVQMFSLSATALSTRLLLWSPPSRYLLLAPVHRQRGAHVHAGEVFRANSSKVWKGSSSNLRSTLEPKNPGWTCSEENCLAELTVLCRAVKTGHLMLGPAVTVWSPFEVKTASSL